MSKTILIVDDEADIRNLVKEILEDEGYKTLTAANSKQVYDILDNEKPDMAVLDIWLQDSRHDGLQILEAIKTGDHAHIPVIMISGHGSIETAVSAIKQGAYDFIEKPFKSDRLLLMVQRGLEASALQQENIALKQERGGAASNVDIIGSSYHAKNLRERIKVLAKNKSRLLIEGPLGVGKTTIARLIHDASKDASEPFIVHICSHINQDVDVGQILQSAQNGTVVFQDVDLLPDNVQKQLLAALQDNSYSARVIGTTRNAEDLNENVRSRISIEHLIVPSLQERKQDISDILEVYVRQVALELGVTAPDVSAEVVRLCQDYQWTGNLYELQAAMIWAIVHNDGEATIQPSSLPVRISKINLEAESNVEALSLPSQSMSHGLLDLPLRDAREVFEREYLTSQVERFEGNISQTAKFIGMERSALHRKIKSLQDKENNTDVPNEKAASVAIQ